MTHLLDRFGSETVDLLAAADEHDAALPEGSMEPRWTEPLTGAPDFLRAEVAWAVTHEGAAHLDDVLLRRVRLDLERRDRGLSLADEVLAVMAPQLGWSDEDVARERESYASRVAQIAAAEAERDDAAAVAHVGQAV